MGDSARPDEVIRGVAVCLGISDAEQTELNKSGQARFSNDVHWARFYLVKAGLLNASERGVWSLTVEGRQKSLSDDDALQLFLDVHQRWKQSKSVPTPDESTVDSSPDDIDESSAIGYREALLSLLKSLPPTGFEHLCKRLLLESGFEKVEVTGRSGEMGIDGRGILQVNPLVSLRVLFQCKRYSYPVGPDKIRDFRGAMDGRTDRGIMLTTSTFTPDARTEATRDGALHIELVDGDKLVDMFEKLELGLLPIKAYEIDREFFAGFEKV
jgi:restriction system protein